MAQFDCVCLDLDGTISDSEPGILNGFRYMFKHMQRPVPTDRELLEYIGLSLDKSLAKYTDFNEEELKQAILSFREYYGEKGLFEAMLYPGMAHLLETVHQQGVPLFLVTAKPVKFAERILAHFHLDSYFTAIYGLDPDQEYPGKAVHLREIKAKYSYQKMIMIGDREMDVLAAHEAQTASIGVLYGYGTAEEMQKAAPTYSVNSANEIGAIIL